LSTVIEVKSPMNGEVYDTYDVFCGWGEAADVCINLRRKLPADQMSTDPHFVSLDFDADAAEKLGKALLLAVEQAREFDKSLAEYFELHKNDPQVDVEFP
jgi:hypothetical protein